MVDDVKQRVPSILRNGVSLFGGLIGLISLANIIFLLLVDFFAGGANPYIGMVTYMVLPGLFTLGLVIIIIGAVRERHRRRSASPDTVLAYPKFDLNSPRTRSVLIGVGSFSVIFLFLTGIGSYRAYEFTDSVQFCGQLCHNVMSPEFTAYQKSPHARVRCVDCHVGPGADWYVKSKMSGMRQVYAASFNKFPRPIPSPVENLRPAQQTCEQCHWPEKFHGAQLRTIDHYGYDEKNTPRQIRLLVKTGGGSPTNGLTTGIHWHMNIANEVTYVSTDRQRQVIPWVRIKDKQGRVTEYMAKDATVKPEQIAKMPQRHMDCVDCHNRPTHIYVPPDRAVDDLLMSGKLDITLPYIKQNAVTVLVKEYPTTQAAMEGIATTLDSTYMTKYPEVYKQKQTSVKQAIAEVQHVYKTNIFPEMKLDWRTHPNNIGHLYSAGCFRCHDGQHVSKEGKIISRECETCHDLLGQEEGALVMAKLADPKFKHPGGEMDFSAVNCNDCHNGGPQ